MNWLLKGMQRRLAGLFIVLSVATFPAWGITESVCTPDSAVAVHINSVNVRQSLISAGTVLDTSQWYNVPYTCIVGVSSARESKTSLVFTPQFAGIIQQISRLGLGLSMTVQDQDQTAGTKTTEIGWDQIKEAGGTTDGTGNAKIFPFGFKIELKPGNDDTTVHRTMRIQLKLYVVTTYKSDMLILTVPGMPALYILSNNEGFGNYQKALSTSAFSIRIFPDNLGNVTISPLLVNFGRFFTTDASKKSQPFTVTAQQKNRPSQSFQVPLTIRFGAPSGLELTPDNQSVKLKNTSVTTCEGGIPCEQKNDNGLALSITDSITGKKVIFNKDEDMGNISLDKDSLSGLIRKTYYAELNTIPGATVQTGRFEVSVPVVVRYN
ncbi:TPA: hypothetical protein ACWV4T_005199 [Salmonella enterica subsp. enterica serovar Muenchen]